MLIFAAYTLSCIDEDLHKKLYYICKPISYHKFTGIEWFYCEKDFFLGFPLVYLNMDYWAPLVWVSLKYSFIYFLFLALHRMTGSTLLDPAGDSIIHETRKLRVTMIVHVFQAMQFFFWHLVFMTFFYAIMEAFFCKCPHPFLRELIAVLIWFTTFETQIYEKTRVWLTPFVPKRFDVILLLLIWIEYQYPGKAIEFIKIIPIGYAIWFYAVGRHREKYSRIFFVSYLPPKPVDDFYEEYKAYKRKSSLFFNVIKYIQTKIK